ncbi:MFS transporter [Paenibacillus sp. UNC451MF]|uniref:MFS transporter n=1 Tax=Paenibacillus sp. UNC451MF TaxID=1449063 RepID=UPI00048BE776|nr:MFS transporter [Paenibacillus sp. UNC451MF]
MNISHQTFRTSNQAIAWLCVLAFFSVLNETVFNVALPDIAKQFGVLPAAANWVNTSFILSFSIGSVVYGKISDLFGVKKLLLFGILIYSGGSLFGLLAHTFLPAMIAARFIQGVGASAVPALIMVMIARFVDSRGRGKAFGMVGSLVATGEGIGPALGGLITQYVHWSLLFLIPIITLVVLPFLYKRLPYEPPVSKGKIDLLGISILSIGISLFSLYMTNFHWSSLLTGVGFIGWFAFHIKRSKNPFIEPHLFKKRNFILCVLSGCILLGTTAGFLSMVPYMMKDVHHLAAGIIGSGIIFPGTTSVILFGMIGGILVDKWGNRFILCIGLTMILVSFLILSLLLDQSPWITTGMLILTLGGLSFIKTVISNTVAGSLDPENVGAGMGLLNFACFLSEGFGIAFVGGMLSQELFNSQLLINFKNQAAYLYSNMLLVFILIMLIGGAVYLLNDRRIR